MSQDGEDSAHLRRWAWPLTIGLWTFSFLTFAASVAASMEGRMPPWIWLWLTSITATGLVVSLILWRLARVLQARPLFQRLAALGGFIVVMAAAQSAVDGVLSGVARDLFGSRTHVYFHLPDFTLNWLIYVWLLGFYAASLELLAMLDRAIALERANARYAVAAAEARELAREAQLQMLRLQLNPHFLFNTLNGISSLVVTGRPAQAEEMLQRLTRFLRASLGDAEAALVPLAQELAAAEAYLDIEAARFSDALNVEIDCAETLGDVLAPSLILQPLLENAVKHALAPSDGAAKMRLSIQEIEGELHIEVEDDGGALAGDVSGSGLGLENVRRRLRALYGDAARLSAGKTEDGFRAHMRLPIQRMTAEKAA